MAGPGGEALVAVVPGDWPAHPADRRTAIAPRNGCAILFKVILVFCGNGCASFAFCLSLAGRSGKAGFTKASKQFRPSGQFERYLAISRCVCGGKFADINHCHEIPVAASFCLHTFNQRRRAPET